MKSSELMIGDWILWNGIPSRVHTITAAEEIMLSNAMELSALTYMHNFSHIDPTPLTEDMLKANGWMITKGNPSQGTMTRGFLKNIGFVYFFDDGIEFEIGIHTRVRGIMGYVHELQHAFRLCGLSELADNFKME